MTLSSIPELANIVLPAFLVIAAGFVFSRTKKIDISSINDLVVYVTTPCLIISSLSDFTMNPSVTAKIFLSMSAVIFATIIIGGALTKTFRLDSRVYLPPVVFANTGNLGLPLCLFAFGQYGFNIAILCVVSAMLLHYTVGILILGSGKDLREVFRLPLIYATVAGIIINSVGLDIPVVIERPVTLLGEITIPAMLFSLGYKLSEMELSRLWLSFFFGSARIFLGVFLGVVFANMFGLKGVEAKVVILECAMPPAVFNFVLAEKYGRDSETVASIIVAGTAVSLLVLPQEFPLRAYTGSLLATKLRFFVILSVFSAPDYARGTVFLPSKDHFLHSYQSSNTPLPHPPKRVSRYFENTQTVLPHHELSRSSILLL